ncbi:PQQ-dependent sugar dehydrogenase [Shimia sp. R11_0]|uniref:PQQ-dependent sugar dehydrogenase n=1 Tax=Shimia sp. R11_0 TaxID=2821096 RepID=UPI001ADBEE3D|nr:PQQ-dependent sugar dehydrogenase [Shimia sp. R11_0]MBO9477131.1 PQQ-dependent sugar dehydrogenase [Shimia sp. R11_0]
MRRFPAMSLVCMCLLVFAVPKAHAQSIESSQGRLKVEAIVTNLEEPWAVAHLPDKSMLITQRGGELFHISPQGAKTQIAGVPEVHVQGQGGLLDVVVDRDFENTGLIFFSASVAQARGAGTAVFRAELSSDRHSLRNVLKIFEMAPGSSGGRHFGSRIVDVGDRSLFVTIGERGDRPSAQQLDRHEGSVVRINKSGGAYAQNPFVGKDNALPEIWSYGHRNPQGAALDVFGQLWVVEHGAKGGDEINAILKGRNYGWPVISYGKHYSGFKIGEGTQKQGMEQPAFYWDPSIAPSGLMIYSGKLWPEWRGHFFVGSLKSDYISRLSGLALQERERLRGPATQRVRDVREGPDGGIWFLSVDKGTLYRMTPRD